MTPHFSFLEALEKAAYDFHHVVPFNETTDKVALPKTPIINKKAKTKPKTVSDNSNEIVKKGGSSRRKTSGIVDSIAASIN